MKNLIKHILLLVAVAFSGILTGQEEPPKIDAAEKKQVIDTLVFKMETLYVFPDKGKEMAGFVRQQWKNGVYDDLENVFDFSAKLTEDLVSVSHDLHIGVRYSPETIARIRQQRENGDDSFSEYIEET
ncbi:MAG: hypothetical protein B6D64_09030, partial [Bacteroidetes bacterium 4484_276]